eukprot:jgi/Galph1/1957/GphlegSOOS_G653.1
MSWQGRRFHQSYSNNSGFFWNRRTFWLAAIVCFGFFAWFSFRKRREIGIETFEWSNEQPPRKGDLKDIYYRQTINNHVNCTVTVIISCFMRPTGFKTVALSFLNQSTAITSVIAYISGSPFKNEYLSIVETLRKRDERISAFVSDKNLGYFGRFQMALQLTTDFVAFADDDVVQGPKTIEALIKAYKFEGFVGVLGVRGVVYDSVHPLWQKKLNPSTLNSELNNIQSDLAFSCVRPTEVQSHWLSSGSEVDTLFSFWFMPSSWVRILYMEEPVTRLTAEDMFVSYMIQKYLGKPTYWLYSDDPEFCGYLTPDLGNLNRSWVDVKDNLPNVEFSQLHKSLSILFQNDVNLRTYRWVRNAVLASLVERGFALKRLDNIRKQSGRALLIFPYAFLKNSMEQTISRCLKQSDVSIWLVCRSADCSEHRESSSILSNALSAHYSLIFLNKIFRIQISDEINLSTYYSKMLIDITALIRSQRIAEVVMVTRNSIQAETVKLAAQMEHATLRTYEPN